VRLTAFTKYDRLAASTRQRLLQYQPYLEAAGIELDCRPLIGSAYLKSLGTGRRRIPAATASAYLSRLSQLLTRQVGDVIWIYAELFPYLPPAFERLARATGRPIVYDLDDAFFHIYDSSPRPMVRELLGNKLQPLLRDAAICTCGNPYVLDYARRHSRNSVLLPTVVDTDLYRPRLDSGIGNEPLVIGWIGSPSTWCYVRHALPVLAEMCSRKNVRFRVIGAGAHAKTDYFPGMELADWAEEREVADVQQMDIGIMPLPDEPFTRGKSGYKLVQYMACAVPAVASPVGVNSDLIEDGGNGFLASSPEQWRQALSRLIDDAELRRRLGAAGRAKAEAGYSLAVHGPRFVEILNRAHQLGNS
jgi:glycosyltransferase involved in cell wall biosynthesis